MARPRIAFVINSIGYGGAERALAEVLAAAPAGRHERHLVLLDREPERRAMPPVEGRHVLDGKGSMVRSARRLHGLFRELRPDLVVSFLIRANVASVAAARRLPPMRVAVCERMHTSSHLALRHSGPRLWAARLLPRLAYPRADAVLAVSEGVAGDLAARFGVPRARIEVIPNPYDLAALRAAGAAAPAVALPPDGFLVASGRLVAAKDMAGLIDAHARSKTERPLVILGEGPERAALERLAADRGRGRVLLPGYAANPHAIVSRAHVYLSASLNEGFPNAMVEAMALAVPVVATDCPSGPAEILGAGAGPPGSGPVEAPAGLIVPTRDPLALAEAIRFLEDPARRARLSAAAATRAGDFTASVVAARYWQAFDRLLSAQGPSAREP
jgi:glycosyltransferase involved in cell wall biosynthesis